MLGKPHMLNVDGVLLGDLGLLRQIHLIIDPFLIISMEMRIDYSVTAGNNIGVDVPIFLVEMRPPFIEFEHRRMFLYSLLLNLLCCPGRKLHLVKFLLPSCPLTWQNMFFFFNLFFHSARFLAIITLFT